jgi:hypothetical protein
MELPPVEPAQMWIDVSPRVVSISSSVSRSVSFLFVCSFVCSSCVLILSETRGQEAEALTTVSHLAQSHAKMQHHANGSLSDYQNLNLCLVGRVIRGACVLYWFASGVASEIGTLLTK